MVSQMDISIAYSWQQWGTIRQTFKFHLERKKFFNALIEISETKDGSRKEMASRERKIKEFKANKKRPNQHMGFDKRDLRGDMV